MCRLTNKVQLRGHDEQNGDRAEPRAIGQLLGPRPLQPALGRHGGTGSAIRVAWHRADRGALILRSARRAPVFGRSRCLAERGVKRAVGEHGASAEGPRHRVRRPMAACHQEAADEQRSNCLRHELLPEIACARSFGARPNAPVQRRAAQRAVRCNRLLAGSSPVRVNMRAPSLPQGLVARKFTPTVPNALALDACGASSKT